MDTPANVVAISGEKRERIAELNADIEAAVSASEDYEETSRTFFRIRDSAEYRLFRDRYDDNLDFTNPVYEAADAARAAAVYALKSALHRLS